MTPPSRLFVGSVVGAVVLAVGAGLFLVGSPGEARRRRLDERRIEDLLGISSAIEQYVQQEARLPSSLGEITQRRGPGLGIDSTDPITRAIYGYRVIDSTHYELCATFERSSGDALEDRGRWAGDRAWGHDAGRQCFRREVHDRR